MQELIKIEDLHFKYNNNKEVIKGIDLSINKSEFICILGHNGSGKSTLAKLLVGLLNPTKGSIYINDIKIDENTIDEVRKNIGIVFQNPDNQFVGITVKDDIAFGLENRKIERSKMLELIDIYSKKVRMNDFLERNPVELSGGEKQRVAIAGILAMNSEIIIFDEATSMLDPLGVREVMDLINSLKNEKTIITITHNISEALYADRVIVMDDGKIVLNGKPSDVFKEFEKLKEYKLDILDSMKLIELVNSDESINKRKEVVDALWELSYQK